MDKQLNTLHKNPTWIQQNLKQSCSDSTLTVFVFYNEVTWMIFWGNFLLVNGLTTQYLKTRSKFKYLFDSLWWSWSHWRGRFQNLLAFWGHKTSFLRYIELTFEVWKFVKSFFAHYICSIFSDNQSKLNNWLVWSYCLIFKEMGYWFSRTPPILKNRLIRVSKISGF